MQRADGSQSLDTLLALTDADAWPTSARAGGAWLAYEGSSLGSGKNSDATDPMDIFFLDLGTRKSQRTRLPGAQRDARFSPDGHWVAYQSTETGRWQVHVRPWPAMDANYQISSDGGTEPVWSTDGRRLYFRHESEVMESAIAVRDGVIESSNPRALFTGTYAYDPVGDWSYDVAPDDRFLMLRPERGRRVQVEIALNWIAGVRARLEQAR